MNLLHLSMVVVTATMVGLGEPLLASEIFIDGRYEGSSATISEANPETPVDASNYLSIRSRNVAGSERHEAVLLRFKLPEEKTRIRAARLDLGLYADMQDAVPLRLYGVREGAVGSDGKSDMQWDQAAVTYHTAPGMKSSDGDLLSQDHVDGDVVLLGEILANPLVKNEILVLESFDPLVDFINSDTDHSVTLLLEAEPPSPGKDHWVQILSGQRASSGTTTYPTLILEFEEP